MIIVKKLWILFYDSARKNMFLTKNGKNIKEVNCSNAVHHHDAIRLRDIIEGHRAILRIAHAIQQL